MTKYIFDLDDTIWDCFSSEVSATFGKHLTPPFRAEGDTVVDSKLSVCYLHEGVKSILENLRADSQDVGFLSLGAKPQTAMEEQPSVLLLKAFGIYKFFNAEKILDYYLDENDMRITKERYLKDIGPCVFIDDDDTMLESARNVPGVKAIDRKTMGSWKRIFD